MAFDGFRQNAKYQTNEPRECACVMSALRWYLLSHTEILVSFVAVVPLLASEWAITHITTHEK